MPDQRRRSSYNDSSPEPIVIERRPQVRTYRILHPRSSTERKRLTLGSKLYNLFKIRKKKVHIIEEEPVRCRERHIRTPSFSSSPTPSPPPPPSPPRRAYRPMSSRMEGEAIYAPLPPVLPHKGKHRDDDVANIIERIPHRRDSVRKVKIVHGDRRDPDDVDAYPKVETSRSPRRDSGKYYVTSEGETSGARRREYERSRPLNADHHEVERLVDDLAWEKRQRREAERAAAHAEDKVNKLQDKLYREQRELSLEKKERDILVREKRLSQEREKRLSQERGMERVVEIRPRPATATRGHRNDVVVVHNPREREVVPVSIREADARKSALERARDDYNVQRRKQQYEERRPGTSGGTGRGQVVIVDDDDYHPRPRR
ncbi:hypothetical protein LTR72_000342 [Exophiala xenobiotica]|nr:hypothetical protein LTR41_001066 [Exophiala xenobiotica]KAK5231162.1 hypothetical protein LTR72_000342 [Exophiala xenobiotica]KAK5299676.1 hypothetical protein LTR14_001890 [Exophiala xenobiotica]KAK5499483.1 hypothetical protein LTR55_000306 [Exophiala xenobiotica]